MRSRMPLLWVYFGLACLLIAWALTDGKLDGRQASGRSPWMESVPFDPSVGGPGVGGRPVASQAASAEPLPPVAALPDSFDDSLDQAGDSIQRPTLPRAAAETVGVGGAVDLGSVPVPASTSSVGSGPEAASVSGGLVAANPAAAAAEARLSATEGSVDSPAAGTVLGSAPETELTAALLVGAESEGRDEGGYEARFRGQQTAPSCLAERFNPWRIPAPGGEPKAPEPPVTGALASAAASPADSRGIQAASVRATAAAAVSAVSSVAAEVPSKPPVAGPATTGRGATRVGFRLTLQDGRGAPLAEVEIEVLATPEGRGALRALSDSQGQIEMSLEPGSYRLLRLPRDPASAGSRLTVRPGLRSASLVIGPSTRD